MVTIHLWWVLLCGILSSIGTTSSAAYASHYNQNNNGPSSSSSVNINGNTKESSDTYSLLYNSRGGDIKLRLPRRQDPLPYHRMMISAAVTKQKSVSVLQTTTTTTKPAKGPSRYYQRAGDLLVPPKSPIKHLDIEKSSNTTPSNKATKLDYSIFAIYFCTAVTITLPVILIPLIGEDHISEAAAAAGTSITSFVAKVASISIMGGGFGKLVNGIICQQMGGKFVASTYLLGMSVCSLILSMNRHANLVGPIVAGMEFFSSAVWIACSCILAAAYKDKPISFARGVTFLSLSSTSGQLCGKLVGSALLQFLSWRNVARVGSLAALVGSLVVHAVIANPTTATNSSVTTGNQYKREDTSKKATTSPIHAIKSIVTNPLFWLIGLGHNAGYMARTCDRLLGTYLKDVTQLPHQLCGGLTASVTFGFVYGLMSARSFHKLPSVAAKTKRLRNGYISATLGMVGLALCANPALIQLVNNPIIMAALVVMCSGWLASSVAFQFFQIPNLVSSSAVFLQHKAICLSFIDGMGFFLTAPIWTFASKIVARYGWSTAWLCLAFIFSMGATSMLQAFSPILQQEQQKANTESHDDESRHKHEA